MSTQTQRGRARDGAGTLVPQRLAELLGVLAHPQRIRIVQRLGAAEQNVASLGAHLGMSSSGVSQHLALLRAHRLVADRRDGRLVYYRLANSGLAGWLSAALDVLEQPSD